MSFELWNLLATTGTLVVIAATAIAALVQLRHTRGSNQIIAMDGLRQTSMSPDFVDAQAYVITQLQETMQDPAFRRQLLDRSARTAESQEQITKISMIGNFYTYVGELAKRDLLDRDLVFAVWGTTAVINWRVLEPVTAIVRRVDPTVWANFEYAAVLSEQYAKAHPDGEYPRGARRLPVHDEWLEADARYAESLPPV